MSNNGGRVALMVLLVDHKVAHREVNKLARDIEHSIGKHPQGYNGDEIRHIILDTIQSGAYYRLSHARNGWEMEDVVLISKEEFNIIMTDEVNWDSTRNHTGRSPEQQVMNLPELVDNYVKYADRDWTRRLRDRGFDRCIGFDLDGVKHERVKPTKVRKA